MRLNKLIVSAAAAAFVISGLAVAPAARAAGNLTNGCISSVPEPGTTEPVAICYSLYRPDGADATHPVPVVFHSHGWGGSRTNSASAFAS
ncbi:MAG: peptidase S15, partial [Microthrixaceae bacterium]